MFAYCIQIKSIINLQFKENLHFSEGFASLVGRGRHIYIYDLFPKCFMSSKRSGGGIRGVSFCASSSSLLLQKQVFRPPAANLLFTTIALRLLCGLWQELFML